MRLLCLLFFLTACNFAAHPTAYDPVVPDLRTEDMKVADFIVQLEKKYKREELNNSIDLHFTASTPRRIKIRLTYGRDADPTKASSIADAAVELAKRLKREDAGIRDIEIGFDREVVRRED